MNHTGAHGMMGGDVSPWSSCSGTPSPPPPPPLPPHTASRWATAPPQQHVHHESGPGCPQCRGRFASMNSRTTSINSYSLGCKGKNIIEFSVRYTIP